jgi:hypothetical protein
MSSTTALMIGNDILDIGSRKARRQRDDAVTAAIMGVPGQFDIPNVSNVRVELRVFVTFFCFVFVSLCSFLEALRRTIELVVCLFVQYSHLNCCSIQTHQSGCSACHFHR